MPRDPMMEIFMAECQDLISQYETYLSMAEEKQEYDLNLINEIFRITHTLKADATMMLYESIAVPMRAFEKVLYYCRDEIKGVLDFDEFSQMLTDVIEFCADELMRIEAGNAAETDGDELRERILQYRDRLAARMHPDAVEVVEEKAKSGLRIEPMRFYIGGQTDLSRPSMQELREEAAATSEPRADAGSEGITKTRAGAAFKEGHYYGSGRQTVTSEELTELNELIERLRRLEDDLTVRLKGKLTEVSDLINECDCLIEEFSDWANRAWMVPISYLTPKLRRTVREMNDRLGRAATLTITGDNVPVEKSWTEHLSSALVHLIRNAIDHGIESKESRISKGKTPEGNISILYRELQEERCFELQLSDDGRGMNMDKVKAAAVRKGLVDEETELSANEALKLVFAPGVTTNEQAGEYSGRGVGMDVVWHNVRELGGVIRVDNREDNGVTVVIRLPYHNPEEEERETFDEDIDSRR